MVDAQPTRNIDLNATLTNFWEINKIPDECNDPEATDVQKHFQDTIEFNKVTGRYNVRLPWKDNKQNLPTNFTLTKKKRLNNLQHTLKGKHPERIYKYNDQLLDQLKRGFIEQVLDPNTHQGVIHYIPHFPVFKESSTTAMRIVYDASAKISSTALSLNDCLHTGPDLIQRLQNMLLTFRSHKIAFTADIEKAFLQIELNTQDRDATRFLWFKDVDKSANNPDNLVVYRFCRVLFGAAPSPYLLNATILHHLIKQGDWISKDLQRSIYIDNVLTGTDTISEALQYYTSSRNCVQKTGMNLQQWTSNSPALIRQAHDDGVYAEPMVKVLRLNWNTKTILTEIEATMNSCPLTYPYTDINDGPPLTPFHFLRGHRILTLPDTEEDSNYIPQESAKDLSRRAKYHQKIMQAFWKQRQRQYLTSLREQHSSQKNKNISGERVARGKVVLIHHETPRNQWKLGVIIQLHQGKDGLVRSVTLRTAKGNLISRPTEKLYPLEVLAEEDNLQDSNDKFENPEEIRSTSEKRTQRATAQRAAL